MPINFPVTMAIAPGGWGSGHYKEETEYTVGTGRVDNDMAVYVSKNGDQIFHKYVPLKRRFYHLSSPAERIRRTVIKAQKIADKANHDELYITHEAEISVKQ